MPMVKEAFDAQLAAAEKPPADASYLLQTELDMERKNRRSKKRDRGASLLSCQDGPHDLASEDERPTAGRGQEAVVRCIASDRMARRVLRFGCRYRSGHR